MTKRSPARTDFLASIIVTAIEGGIDYWALTKDYEWRDNDGTADFCLADARVTVAEADWPDGFTPVVVDGKWYTVTLDTIAHGLSLIRKRDDIQCLDKDTRKYIIGADGVNEGGDIDACYADVILQVALFGEVRYG